MAAETDGAAMLKFGTTTITGWVVVSVSETESGSEVEVPDESGDIITHISEIGVRTEVTLELMAKSGTSMLAVGDPVTYTNHSGTSKTARITSVGNVQTQGQVMRTTVQAKFFPGVAVS